MMKVEAIGTFEVKLTPIDSGESPIGSMLIDKTFNGDLQGTSTGHLPRQRREA